MSASKVPLLEGLWLAVAESCTGGMLGARITAEPGASLFFRGGVIAYADEVKEKVLGVRSDLLRAHGAVSAECALAMAWGVLGALSADVALAVTGIAGPGGGTPDKPVGLVYLALAKRGEQGRAVELHLAGSREEIRAQAVCEALALLEERPARCNTGEGSDRSCSR